MVGIPIGVAAIALGLLWKRYDEFATYFFAELYFNEQAALLALLFAVVFAAVGISQAAIAGSTDNSSNNNDSSSRDATNDNVSVTSLSKNNSNSNHSSSNKTSYPLHEMNLALSDRSKFASLYPWLRDSILETIQTDDSSILHTTTTTSTTNNNNNNGSSTTTVALVEYLSKMMDYTIMGGKFHRGTTVVTVYRTILGRVLTPLEHAQACTLGWTIEFLQAFFLVADDVMDESIERRGQPCWYQVDDVQLKAINDAFLLESFVYTIVKQFFGHLPCYVSILELVLEVIQKTELGQLLGLQMPKKDEAVDFTQFTIERYQSIVRFKTAYYTFYLPVALAMSLAGIEDPATYQRAKEICCVMGEYFQVQADVMDCYGDPRHSTPSGDEGSDIQDNKCSWLICHALSKCSPAQRQILEDNYGIDDDEESVQTVKGVYLKLQLPQAFQAYQEESYAHIQELLEQVQIMPKQVFHDLIKKVYKRKNK